MNFENEVRIAYSSVGKRQAAYGTALAQADLDMAFRANVRRMTPRLASKIFRDCSGQFIQTKRTLALWDEVELEFEVTPQLAALFGAFAMGTEAASGTNPLTHQENLLAGRLLPVQSLRVGFDDGVDSGRIIKDVAVADFSLSGRSGFDSTITARVRLLASADDAAATGTSWPTCYSTLPSTLFDASRSLTLNGTEYITSTHAVTFSYSNNVEAESGFTAGSIFPQRWLRGTTRAYDLSFTIEGIDAPADALATLARASNREGTIVANSIWTFGTANNTFSCKVPSAYLAFRGTPQDFLGANQANVAVLNLGLDARKVTSAATEPFNFTAVIDTAQQAVAYLTT